MTDLANTHAEMDDQMAAYECRLATCEHLSQDDHCTCGQQCGDPEHCQSFRPRHQVRVARREDGSFYCSRTEKREYLDLTLAWVDRQSAAEQIIQIMEG